MVDFKRSLKLPFSNLQKLSFLAALFFVAFGFWSIPNLGGRTLLFTFAALAFYLYTTGYGLSIAASAAKGKFVLSEFGNIRERSFLALKFLAGLAIYFAPVLLLLIIGEALPEMYEYIFQVSAVLIFLVLIALLAYSSNLIAVHYAVERRFSAIFEIKRILKFAFTSHYFLAWLFMLGVGLSSLIVLGFANVISVVLGSAGLIVLLLVQSFVSAIILPISMSVYGQAYGSLHKRRRQSKPL